MIKKSLLLALVLILGISYTVLAQGELSPEETAKKPTIFFSDFSDLKIESVSNSWGPVSVDTTTINTEIVVNNPNFCLIPLKVHCDIYLNDIKVVSGLGKDLKIRKCASGTYIRLTSKINNKNIIKWWVSHINNGEKTRVRIEGKLILSLPKVDIVYPFFQESEFETNMLQGLSAKPEVIRPWNFTIALKSKWGKVTLTTTKIKPKVIIKNIGILLGQPITDIDYKLGFNGIQMTEGRVRLPIFVLPGQQRSVEFTLEIPNRNIIKWWVSHIHKSEKTKYCFQYRLWTTPLINLGWKKILGFFKTNILSI